MQTITSKDNQYLKLLRSLQGKKGRQEQGLFVVEGLRLTAEAAEFAQPMLALFCQDELADPRLQALADKLSAAGAPLYCCDRRLFAAAADTGHPQGVMAAVPLPVPVRPQAAAGFWAYANDLSDPGNLGTIIRTAHAAGALGLLLSPQTVDVFNPKTVRASMGAIFKLPLYRCESAVAALALMEELGAPPLAADAGGVDVRDCGPLLARPHTWVLGAEAAGLDQFWRQHAAQVVSLPMRVGAESLNVAAAAAVLLYQSCFAGGREDHKQRGL